MTAIETPANDPSAITAGAVVGPTLVRHGVKVIFGIPGVHTVEVYRSLAEAGLSHVTPRHEQGAVVMADGMPGRAAGPASPA